MKKTLRTNFQKRQYMLSKDYEIYYYSDTDACNVKPHSHTYYEFYVFLEGNVSMKIQEEEYPLSAGMLCVIPPNIIHQAQIHDMDKPYRRIVFWVSEEYVSSLIESSKDYGYLLQLVIQSKEYVFPQDVVSANEIQSKLFRLLSEVHSNRFGRDSQIQICVQDVLLLLNRKIYEQRNRATEDEAMSLYQNLLIYMEEHLDEDLSLEILAGKFYVSKYYLSHLFKEHTGISLHQYVTKVRLELARDALLANDRIVSVYESLGFSDYSSFYRAFKKEYGMGPKEYLTIYKHN